MRSSNFTSKVNLILRLELRQTWTFLLLLLHLPAIMNLKSSSNNVILNNSQCKTAYLSLQVRLLPISLSGTFTSSSPPLFLLIFLFSLSPVTRRFSEAVLKSFCSPSKCGAKTHGCCTASLLCANGRAPVHDNEGRMKGLALGAEIVGQTSF